MTPQAQRWLDMADYDLDVARLCFDSGVYVYCVFFCHLALEKLLKAIVLDKLRLEEPPYIHNLSGLAEIVEIELSDEHAVFLARLTPRSVGARYPESLSDYDKNLGEAILLQTNEVFQWLKSRLM